MTVCAGTCRSGEQRQPRFRQGSHLLPKPQAIGLGSLQCLRASVSLFDAARARTLRAFLDQVRNQVMWLQLHKSFEIPSTPNLQWLWCLAAICAMPNDCLPRANSFKHGPQWLQLGHATCCWLLKARAASAQLGKQHCQSGDYQVTASNLLSLVPWYNQTPWARPGLASWIIFGLLH